MAARGEQVGAQARGMAFRRWATPAGVAPSALFDEPLSVGVYVLEFADGQEYVGQSVNFPVRFATHRRRWDDIVAVRFTPLLADDLDEVERAVVRDRVQAGVTLRNRTLLAQPLGPSGLDTIIDPQVQAAWLEASADDDDVQIADDRFAVATRRARSRERHDLLRAHPSYDAVLDSLAFYVGRVIPWPDTTEGRLWTLTAMPSTSRTRDNRRLATLSIQNVETLVLAEGRDDDGEWQPYTLLNTAVAHDLPDDLAEIAVVTDGYRSAGELHHFAVDGVDVVPELLDDPQVLRAARSLALAQLRKGRAAFARHHNDALTDAVFARIGELLQPVE